MFSSRSTTDTPMTEKLPDYQPPSTIGGWARAVGWGSLAVAGCGAILMFAAPGELVGANPMPCDQVRDQASCRLVEPAVTATAVPTFISTPGQVPFARSPTP